MTRLALLLPMVMVIPALADSVTSHPPQRPLPKPSGRPMGQGRALFADPAKGHDANDGSKDMPWRTINHALALLAPGDTLYLRGGSYFENVYCAIAGTKDKPITIRSYPGEVATIDGGIPEFQTGPARAWEVVDEGLGEYRSVKAYKNLRDVIGRFGDSNVGLQTYWYAMDLRARNEAWIPSEATFIEPIYCGPGIFYDKQTGRIHCRLAHTTLAFPPEKTSNFHLDHYRGETDPRKLPLVIAPFNSRPLFVDQAMYVCFQDLVFCGGGHETVNLRFGVGLEFDGCTIYCGTYGIWSKGTGPLKMTNCGVYGMMAPWFFRDENSSYAYSATVYPPFVGEATSGEVAGKQTATKPRVVRHIARLTTHAVLVTEGGYEFETFYYPHNHDWEVSYCEFTDAHDGIYPSGRDIHFHHNWVDEIQDDAVYLSSPTPYVSDKVYIYQNLISTATSAFGLHARGGPGGDIYVFRNVVDMRRPVRFCRTPERPNGGIERGRLVFNVHSADHMIHVERFYLYHNTCLFPFFHIHASYLGGMLGGWLPDTPRRIFNNLSVFYGGGGRYPTLQLGKRDQGDLQVDGNLHWSLTAGKAPQHDWLKTAREHPLALANKERYPPGLLANEFAADPMLTKVSEDPDAVNDYRLRPGSPAIGKGVALPAQWMDPLRPMEGSPDIGAIPFGGEVLKVGVRGRITAGMPGEPK